MTFTFPLLFALAMTMTFFGKAIIGIVMGVMAIASMVTLLNRRAIITKDNFLVLMKAKETIAILVMFGIWILSATQGIKPDKSIKEVFEYIGIIFGGYIIFSAMTIPSSLREGRGIDIEKLFQYCVIGGTLCAGLLTLTPLMGDMACTWGSSYGSVLTLFIPLAFYLARKNSIWWIAVLILASGILASGSRTAWVVLPFLMILIPMMMPQRSIKYFMIMIIVVAIGAFAGLESYKATIGEDAYDMRTEALQSIDRPASGRLIVWDNTINHIMERPLLGHGIKTAQYLEISKGLNQTVIHVHNVVLEMMLETGVIGFLAFTFTILLFVGHFLRAYFRSNDITLKSQAMVVFLSCIAYGVCSMALTSMFHAWWFLYLVVLVILLKIAELRLTPQAP